MAVIRNKTVRYFCMIDSRVIRGGMLSLAGLGLLVCLLDRPDTWKFRVSELCSSLGLPEETVRRTLGELKEKGFAIERIDRYGIYYDVCAFPQTCGETRAAPPPASGKPAAPDAPEPKSGTPMTDEQRQKWMEFIRENFPRTVKSHDLNRVIRTP